MIENLKIEGNDSLGIQLSRDNPPPSTEKRLLLRLQQEVEDLLVARQERRTRHAVRYAENGDSAEHSAFWEMTGAANALIDVQERLRVELARAIPDRELP